MFTVEEIDALLLEVVFSENFQSVSSEFVRLSARKPLCYRCYACCQKHM